MNAATRGAALHRHERRSAGALRVAGGMPIAIFNSHGELAVA